MNSIVPEKLLFFCQWNMIVQLLNHSGMTKKSTHRVLGHSLVRSLVHSHRTLIRFHRTARFACALRCAALRSFVRSLARPFTRSGAHGKEVFVYELNASI